jgi:hypothetical protein
MISMDMVTSLSLALHPPCPECAIRVVKDDRFDSIRLAALKLHPERPSGRMLLMPPW